MLDLFFIALAAVIVNGPTTPPADALNVQVVVTQTRPLALVDWVIPGRKDGETALDGVVQVAITNRSSDTPARLRELEVHGLVFTPASGGPDIVVVHSCQCVRDMSEAEPPSVVVAPGATHTFTVDEWGCSSMWTPPPPGAYQVRYRVLPQAPQREGPPPDGDPREMIKACREALQGEAMWRGAAVSNPLTLTLKTPVRKPIPH